MRQTLSYDDVLLVPQSSDITSRSQVDIGSSLDESIHLEIPIISSPMDTITEEDMALCMSLCGGMGVVHRYNNLEDQVSIIAKTKFTNELASIGAAVGMSGDFVERSLAARAAGANVICVDVAHGHHSMMER
jgi:IMP dehydrogenase